MHVSFAWPGLPDYAARCIRDVIERSEEPVTVVATRPSVPIEGMERSLGQPVIWLDDAGSVGSWSSLGCPVPDVLFCGGYSNPAFNALAGDVRRRGGSVVLMSDHNWRGTLRQRALDPLRHRLFFRGRFDAAFVPGAAGVRLARKLGYEADRTAQRLYGADSELFHGGPPLVDRPRSLLFVGQFIERKNVLGLVEAFIEFADLHTHWVLNLCGSGEQADRIPDHPRVRVHGFVQPPQLAEMLRQTRCLVLPSHVEHWGLVVHEAALSGCALALSKEVGASDDLAGPENAVLFRPDDCASITLALTEIAEWSDKQWALAELRSRERAARFGPQAFADSVDRLVERLAHRAA